ncbi:hypothetical protein OG775_35730 [Streptomyces platensis]|uniref:hypothetical protein n=1 Tax=Streptomyces TaxID=1883 RepID=UPI002001DED4|nr:MULTISPECIES: hypothetical protein [Streptomyces]MCX4640395.1 hypothetical protein [Streptomyces platensis]
MTRSGAQAGSQPHTASSVKPASGARCCGPNRKRARLTEIRDNLIARIAEAEREGWQGEVDGLHVSLADAEDKLAQLDSEAARRSTAVSLGMPTFGMIAVRPEDVMTPTSAPD